MTQAVVAVGFFKGLRALLNDLPEDFILRVTPGLDEVTRASLERGMAAALAIRRWRAAGSIGLAVGALVFGTGLLVPWLWAVSIPLWPVYAAGGLWAAGVSCFLLSGGIYLAHRSHIRHLEGVAQALRGSSLARDLA